MRQPRWWQNRAACSTDTQLSTPAEYVQCCWSIRLASSIMSLPHMSYIGVYMDDIQFISLTCTLHATKYLSQSRLPPASFLGANYPPLAPFGDKKQNLMKCPAYMMFYYDTYNCCCGVWINHRLLSPGTPSLAGDTLCFGSRYFK